MPEHALVPIPGIVDFEERLQFLLQSTESLHSNVRELTASIVELRSGAREIDGRLASLVRVVEVDADSIRRLANIAAAHDDRLEDLGTRLDRLERRKGPQPSEPQ